MSLELEQPDLIEQFEQLISKENTLEIREFLDDQNISDVANLINEFPEYEARIIANMSIHRAVSVFKILDIAQQKDIVKELPSSKTAELLNELPADDRTDFFEELPKAALRDLLKLLDPEEIKITLALLGYPEDSVGRLMTPDYVYVYAHNTIAEVLETIRKYARNSETVDVIYVIAENGELIDDVRIRDIILASPDKRVDEIIDGRVVSLHVTDDQENAAQIFKMNNRVALPVVDENNILLGIVTIDDMLWVANEEFSEDMQKMGGTEALDEPYLDIPLFKLFRKRIGWLVV
ncbi:MAG: magnesium transporter, partial [Chitinophagaceae bacterium]|nr:magnesium transporter [Chitinophagaceae bacterium]